MTTPLVLDVDHPDLLVGVVEARGVSCGPASPELLAEINSALARRAGVDAPPEKVKSAIRDLLRRGGYKPTGRGKPASEYLAQAAARGEWPRINHAVDALNFMSLESGLPISLIDTDRALVGTTGLVVRLGHPGEKYVFNSAGHEIDVEGLLCVARGGGDAIANAVKDSMATKTTPETRNVLAVVWASRQATDTVGLTGICELLGRLMGAPETNVSVLTG